MSGKCYITGAGCHYNSDIFVPEKHDFVIAADGGYDFNRDKGIRTDLIIGDFDSVNSSDFSGIRNIIQLNPVKDETDMICAVKEGMKKGFSEYHIFGGTGGRNDHTVANIQTLKWIAQNGMKGFLYAEKEILTVIHNSSISFDKTMKGYISVFSLENESTNVCEQGLKYTVENYTMTNDFPIGVSNEFTGEESSVSVEKGTLLIIYPRNSKTRNQL